MGAKQGKVHAEVKNRTVVYLYVLQDVIAFVYFLYTTVCQLLMQQFAQVAVYLFL